MRVEDAVIIGAGPAGIAAAIQLKRYGFDPRVFEKDSVGGLLKNANFVENYPGFPGGVRGSDLVRLIQEQAERFSLRIERDRVVELAHEDRLFKVQTDRGEVYHARTAVVASGTQPVPFTDVNIPADLSAKVFYEVFPICTVASKTVAIVGAGDAAFDYALNLARNNDVLILNRTDRIKALPLLVERAAACSRIRYQENARLTGLVSGPNGRLSLVWASAGAEHKTDVDYLIFAVGRQPLLDFLAAGVDSTASENDNLYFCGDVKNARFRQTAIAAGDGIRAAMSIYGKLKERSG